MAYTISTILYASELEPRGPEIFRHAVGIARQFGARLHVITVCTTRDQPFLHDYLSNADLDRLHDDDFRRLGAMLQQRIDELGAAYPDLHVADVLAGIEVLKGNAAQAILDTAKRIGADMIVLGSHGHSAFSELLSGSVAHAVTVHAEVPVLLVPINH